MTVPVPRRRSRRISRIFSLALTVLLAACEFGEVTVPRPGGQVVVHAMLNPDASVQWVLVERTLTGTVSIDTAAIFDPLNPIVTGFGVPVSGARVEIRGADGTLFRGVEDAQAPGVYGIDVETGPRPRPGVRYSLLVRTRDSVEVTGETTIPNVAPAPIATLLEPFDREADTLRLQWRPAAGARTWALRVESPRGPFFIFADSLSLRLPGSLRNLFADRLPRVFVPGFEQAVTVSAVDANFYDYYRSRNDPFTGSGIINRLRGGVGLFGSAVNVVQRRLLVTAPQRQPSEGHWALVSGTAAASTLDLWIETPATSLSPAGLSGTWTGARGRDGFLGVLDGTALRIALLDTRLGADTIATLEGELRGDTITGKYRGAAAAVRYVRTR